MPKRLIGVAVFIARVRLLTQFHRLDRFIDLSRSSRVVRICNVEFFALADPLPQLKGLSRRLSREPIFSIGRVVDCHVAVGTGEIGIEFSGVLKQRIRFSVVAPQILLVCQRVRLERLQR